ncbi:MAG: hypothetical protein CMM93_01640 [Rickettsiales bacterium]|nr:hypothetical protein [Rickettsiales bacterium]|tara:strand:- start:921 stop:1421 length:501 start_codon:yes stop_codon:yes gene_type:complete
MTTLHSHENQEYNPLDVAEALFESRDWLFDRPFEEELIADIAGAWCHYRVWCAWQPDLEVMSFSCSFDSKVPDHSIAKLYPLLGSINEKMWLGHFDICSEEKLITFRHALLLRGGKGATPEQIEDLIDIAIHECDRFYPAFQSVIWGNEQFNQALEIALMDTVGEA